MDIQLLTDPTPILAIAPGTRLAIDTEFHGERHYTPRLHLIQVRAPGGPAWLIDAHLTSLVDACAPALRACPWIVHSGQHDLPLLARALGGVPDEVLDTQIAAGLVGPRYPLSLAHLCSEHLGQTLDKGETLSDWSRRPLSPDQLAYAASDVALLHALWDRLEARCDALGRREIAREACRSEAADALAAPDPDDAWRAVAGHATLTPPALAVLQELASWRERIAIAQDQPVNAVLPHRTLIDLAKRRPLTEGSLLAGRQAPRSTLKKHSEELLDAIARASARPPFGWPRAIGPGTPESARLAWLRAWAEQRAIAEDWSARLVLPDAIATRIALGEAPAAAITGWRRSILGSPEEISGASIGLPALPDRPTQDA